jgi:hypothetical protein
VVQSGAQAPLPDAHSNGDAAGGGLAAAERDAAGDAGAGPGGSGGAAAAGQQQAKESLLSAAAKARKERPAETEAEARLREEAEIMRNITARMALKSVKENAQVRCALRNLLLRRATWEPCCRLFVAAHVLVRLWHTAACCALGLGVAPSPGCMRMPCQRGGQQPWSPAVWQHLCAT